MWTENGLWLHCLNYGVYLLARGVVQPPSAVHMQEGIFMFKSRVEDRCIFLQSCGREPCSALGRLGDHLKAWDLNRKS